MIVTTRVCDDLTGTLRCGGQGVSIGFLHEYVLGNYRALYARVLACGINDYNQAEIIFRLLASGRLVTPEHRAEEGALLYRAIERLPTQRAMRLFARLAEGRVNNRRTRALVRRYLGDAGDREFRAVKYRRKFRVAAAHAHLPFDGELGSLFVKGWREKVRLHGSLLDDFFGELLRDYAILYPHAPAAHAALDGAGVTTLADLVKRVAQVRADWRAYAELLSAGLLGRAVRVERVRTMGPFRLERFVPVFDPEVECHLGERIVRDDGTLEYLKTYRLSAAQVRRAYLLEQLAAADWNLQVAAKALRCSAPELAQRLVSAGFGYLLKPAVLQALPRTGRR